MTNTYYAELSIDVAIKSDLSHDEIQNQLDEKELRADLTLINQDTSIDTQPLLISDVKVEEMSK